MSLLDDLNAEFDIEPSSGEPEPAAPQEVVVEIPGVGGRMEVFKGANHEEVMQKIADSKAKANEFIQQLQSERNYPVYEEPQHYTPDWSAIERQPLTADEMYAMQQGQDISPRLFQAATGMTPEQLWDKLYTQDQFISGFIQKEHTESFLEDNLDYYPTENNMHQMTNYIQQRGLPWTKQALDDAYAVLNSHGLLEQYPAEQVTPVQGTSTGLSDRMSDSSAPTAPATDYSKLSLDEHRQRLIDDFNKNR